jgi:hypothetical protein
MKKKSQYWRSKVTILNRVAGLFQFRVKRELCRGEGIDKQPADDGGNACRKRAGNMYRCQVYAVAPPREASVSPIFAAASVTPEVWDNREKKYRMAPFSEKAGDLQPCRDGIQRSFTIRSTVSKKIEISSSLV